VILIELILYTINRTASVFYSFAASILLITSGIKAYPLTQLAPFSQKNLLFSGILEV